MILQEVRLKDFRCFYGDSQIHFSKTQREMSLLSMLKTDWEKQLYSTRYSGASMVKQLLALRSVKKF